MSFTTKVLLVLTLNSAIVLAAYFQLTKNILQKEAVQSLHQSTQEAERMVQLRLRQLREQLKFTLQVAISDFAFKQAFALKDKATLKSIIENYKGRVKADLFEILDQNGKRINLSDQVDSKEVSAVYLKQAAESGGADFFEFDQGRIFLYALAPIKAPILRGFTKIGLELDKDFLRPMAESTSTDLTLLKTGQENYFFSTVEAMTQFPQVQTSSLGAGLNFLTVASERHIGRYFTAQALGTEEITLLVTRPERKILASFSNLQRLSWQIAIVLLVMALFFSFFWGKAISRRIVRLTQAVAMIDPEEVEFGLEDKGRDEIGVLTTKFSEMVMQLSLAMRKNKDALKTIKLQKEKLAEANSVLRRQLAEEEITKNIVERSMNESEIMSFIEFSMSELLKLEGIRHVNMMLSCEDADQFELINKSTRSADAEKSYSKTTVNRNDILIASKAISSREPQFMRNAQLPEQIKFDSSDLDLKLGSFVSVPMVVNDVEIGVLNFITTFDLDHWKNSHGLLFIKLIASKIAQAVYNLILYNKATRDALTGLSNRAYFLTLLDHEVSRSTRSGKPFSILYMDIDFFKKINDQFGHEAGDKVLIKFSKILSQTGRKIDRAARMGGEEFVFLLPYTEKSGAQLFAEKLRKAIESSDFSYQNKKIPVTASLGVASFPDDTKDSAQLIKKADEALYKAKHNGRNRVETA